MGISRLLWAAKLQSAPGADNPRYAAVRHNIGIGQRDRQTDSNGIISRCACIARRAREK